MATLENPAFVVLVIQELSKNPDINSEKQILSYIQARFKCF